MKSQYTHSVKVHNKEAAQVILPLLFKWWKPASLLDVGCGLGSWLDVGHDLGVQDYLGIEVQHIEDAKLFIPKERLVIHDLTQPLDLNRRFDLALCLEVAEHLPETGSEALVKTLTAHSEVILFSAAAPGQGGQNHINEKRLSYWSTKFMEHEYALYDFIRPQIWNNPAVEVWYRQNIVLFCKKDHYLDSVLRPISSPYIDIIHPEFFEFYSYQAARAGWYEEGRLGLRISITSFIKSVVNAFK